MTIVWKNVGVTADGFDSQPLIKQLFPDQETYKKEEQRRFEILAGHWTCRWWTSTWRSDEFRRY